MSGHFLRTAAQKLFGLPYLFKIPTMVASQCETRSGGDSSGVFVPFLFVEYDKQVFVEEYFKESDFMILLYLIQIWLSAIIVYYGCLGLQQKYYSCATIIAFTVLKGFFKYNF